MAVPKVLVVSGNLEFPLRASVRDLIYSFRNSGGCYAYMYSIEQGPLPEYLKKVNFDLVVFTTLLLGERWGGQEKMYNKIYKPLEFLKASKVTKVVHPQDEWIHTEVLNNFILDFNIDHVFTVAPESEWKKIYHCIDPHKVKFTRVLTGYLEDSTVHKIDEIVKSTNRRDIDVGYRAYRSPPWLGRKGYLKTAIADIFKKEAPIAGFNVDISTEEKDTFYGDDWFRFMARCKYFIGVEGGSAVLDKDGNIFKEATAFEKQNPNAKFEEYEDRFFKGKDGELDLVAISPRHLEACATKTCQVLIEGDYNGVLNANVHYIPLKKDFSNLDEVLVKMKDESLRSKIVDNAYKDIVLSRVYSYKAYAQTILKRSLPGSGSKPTRLKDLLYLEYNKISDKRFWKRKAEIGK